MAADKIIFLDFDGVCTSMDDTPGSYINHELNQYGPSAPCMEFIKKLCRQTNARILVTSNWRNYGFKKYVEYHGKKILNPLIQLYAQIGKRIDGMLPPTGMKQKCKAIIDWFEQTDFNGKFAIIDDDLEEGFQNEMAYDISNHFVKTDTKHGFTRKNLEEALKLLN